MDIFSGKHAIVTGGIQGLGLAISTAFLEGGAAVSVLDVAEAPTEDFQRLSAKYPGQLQYKRTDVSSESSFSDAISEAHATQGMLHFLVNNAGISQMKTPIIETLVEDFNRIVAVDLTSVFIGTKHAAPFIIESGGGAIVNISSTMGLVSQAGVAAYAAAKHGVIGLTKTSALELGPLGIRVNAVCPGRHDTPMVAAWRPSDADTNDAYLEELRRNHPATHRVGKPEEIAAAVTFLCSPGASNVHGISLPVDGGWTAQ
jgi:NAD(P)-dependent dehydrogenase (short-subunit alcohol dehydrogenase family)